MRPGFILGAVNLVVPTTRQLMVRVAIAAVALMPLIILDSGCASGPPVQEMSDARQAISIAREAGAASSAPEDLRQAETLLDSAEKNLANRAYSQARRDAMQAKEKALHALATVEPPQ
jgi:hypothetical protein